MRVSNRSIPPSEKWDEWREQVKETMAHTVPEDRNRIHEKKQNVARSLPKDKSEMNKENEQQSSPFRVIWYRINFRLVHSILREELGRLGWRTIQGRIWYDIIIGLWRKQHLVEALAMQSASKAALQPLIYNSFWKVIFPRAFFSGGVFFSQKPVG